MTVALLIMSSIGCDMVMDFNDIKNPSNKNVAVIGDSLFDLSGEIQEFLAELSGETYEDWTRSGEKITGIAKQYENAIYQNPNLRTVIMDGGANDVLQGNESKCSSYDEVPAECEALLDWIADVLEDMMDDMYVDGLDDVVFVGYYHLPNGKTALNLGIDYHSNETLLVCDSSRVNCHFVDSRPDFVGHESEYIKSDDIHPTSAGSEVVANLIWNKMVDENIEQNKTPDDGNDDSGDDNDDNDDGNDDGCN